ncbi:hypothetical protein AXG93_146s1340 [Marchantia polymorpha subsp. ruderalis]|uniref:Uncharacterized protein n=1 Tax=Marchantia polymorpha subsp. ruderalis TaxID=1480154 RepID=A0A176W7L9_MARPO|nr:hypothetical protein AXG93_146s1340 [Marchantia polymorpha subsp. ruderalis]
MPMEFSDSDGHLVFDILAYSSSCKECEPTFAFETSSSPKMSYAPVALAATKAAGVESVATKAAVFNDMDQ